MVGGHYEEQKAAKVNKSWDNELALAKIRHWKS